MLDIEVAAAVAPKALIAVYFAPNTDKGFLDAITMAIHDTTNKPSVISISWGNPEKNWTAQAMRTFDQAFQTAAALGVTVCCAAAATRIRINWRSWERCPMDWPTPIFPDRAPSCCAAAARS